MRPQPHWTVFACDVECGAAAGAHRIPANDPVHVVSAAIRRCAAHSAVPVDWDQVEDARMTLEVSRRQKVTEPARLTGELPAQPVRRDFTRAAEAKSLPFDARMAAAGDREDA